MTRITVTGNVQDGRGDLDDAPAPHLEHLRWLFLDYAPPSRDEERSIILTARSESRGRAVLMTHEFPGLGLALRLITDLRKIGVESWVSVGDHSTLEDVFDTGDCEFAARGMFLPIEKAWLAVEDFMADPFEKSPRIEWEDAERYPGLPDWML